MSWDAYGGQIFPGAGEMPFHHHHHQADTLDLEAVFQLLETTTAPLQTPAAAAEGEPPLLRNGSSVPAVDAAGAARRRRPLRTDRHSKIRTAQGVRDRRMRLSVGVAQEFFALQDRLGFDKASKTVNWLLTQSKPAIDRLVVDAAEPPAAAVVSVSGERGPTTTAAAVVKGRGEWSSSSTCCSTEDSREEAMDGELGWIMTEATAAAATTTEQPPQMDGLDYYQYCLQLEEMMRCNGGTPR